MSAAKKSLGLIQNEVDASYLYKTLAELEEEEAIRKIYLQMAGIEQRHVIHALERAGMNEAQARALRPSWQARVKASLAKRFGAQMILGDLIQTERAIAAGQARNTSPQHRGRLLHHIQILQGIQDQQKTVDPRRLGTIERRHRNVGGNALRAAVLGANDGLVSNLSLVMGVAGAAVANKYILVTGMAGLLAGALSMALGEWLSVQSARELFQRQLDLEGEELSTNPEEEQLELSLIHQAKGLSQEQALELAKQQMQNEDQALNILAREELGIDPEELGGSAWEAAIASFILFALGAIIPVLPYFFLQTSWATWWSIGLSALGLFGIGAMITLMTGKPVWSSGLRQVFFGAMAAAITFGIGHLFSVQLGG
ncbi:MAG: VIT1/CCC1 transporter family protein [Saprospiraceae bacterium]|nr:VIT1/CCC1 transporter family protein [Saprospiraceae bacterium]